MAVPVNKGKGRGCDIISSNCVVWQGNDLECINLCNGDTISTVTEKVATELCTLMDMFDIDDFDLSALSLTSTPENIQELMQILIDRVATNSDTTSVSSITLEEGSEVYLTDEQIADIISNGGELEFL
jgi:hypothetical protein